MLFADANLALKSNKVVQYYVRQACLKVLIMSYRTINKMNNNLKKNRAKITFGDSKKI